jgi:sigma-B regulation protein RsbU (phosphoserine phosphatase)
MGHEISEEEMETIDLRSLVAHAESVPAHTSVEAVHAIFAGTTVDFIAVAEGYDLVGICARRQVTQQLSSRYGFALNARQPVTAFLMASPLKISRSTPLTDVFKAAAARSVQEFYDDVLLVDDYGRYLGMIPMRALVRLQTNFLLQHNAALEISREEIASKNRAIEEDLVIAREVQLALLPQALPPLLVAGRMLNVTHRYRAAGGMSGDFFDVLRISDHAVGILVCDVMGHGVQSALVTAMMRAMVEELRPVAGNPGWLLTRLNHDLTRILRQAGRLIFVTAAYAMIDLNGNCLRYAQAGHPTPLRWDTLRGVRPLKCPAEAAGPALGLMDDFDYVTVEESFDDGSRLVMFTDGVVEAANAGDEEFGFERLSTAIADGQVTSQDQMLDTLLADVAAFSGEVLADDVCLIAVEVSQTRAERQMGKGVGE